MWSAEISASCWNVSILTSELWAAVWHNYIRDAITSKLHFHLADDVGGHGGIEVFDLPKSWKVVTNDQVVLTLQRNRSTATLAHGRVGMSCGWRGSFCWLTSVDRQTSQFWKKSFHFVVHARPVNGFSSETQAASFYAYVWCMNALEHIITKRFQDYCSLPTKSRTILNATFVSDIEVYGAAAFGEGANGGT